MELLALYIVLGILTCAGAIWFVMRAVHRKSPKNGFGDYFFTPEMPFDLELFPSIVLSSDATQLKILQFADPQLKFGSFPRRDRKTLRLIRAAVVAEKPDLCVVTGDLTLSVFTHFAVKHFVKFMHKLGVKWAFVFGNHDAQYDCGKYHITKLLQKYDNCLFSVGAENLHGVGNYLVNVYRGTRTPENLAYGLFMLDSGMYETNARGKENVYRYDCVQTDQVQWYEWAVKGLQWVRPNIRTTMFFHIPTREFANMYYLNEIALGHNVPHFVAEQLPKVQISDVHGTVCENSKSKQWLLFDKDYTAGVYFQAEKVALQGRTAIFDAIKRLQCTQAVFCGHDHVNTLKGYYDGVYLGYGLCCGYHTTPFFRKAPSKSITWNGKLWLDEHGNRLEKGITVIAIDLNNCDALTVTDKTYSQLTKC